MARLNIKSTRAAFLKEGKDLAEKADHARKRKAEGTHFHVAQWALISVAKELGISFSIEDFNHA